MAQRENGLRRGALVGSPRPKSHQHVPGPGNPTDPSAEPKPLGLEAPAVIRDAAIIGTRRLERPMLGDAVTSLIGAMSVSFGAVAMAWAAASFGGGIAEPSVAHFAGALAFPIGFVILLVGKSELFTENFLLPVTAVLERQGTMRQLFSLWGTSLVGNLVGAFVFALLISRPGVLPDGPANFLIALAHHKLDYSFGTAFIKAIFAGWLMTILTWLLVAAEGMGSKLAIIWAIATLIVVGQFNHVVISACEIFMASFLGAEITFTMWFEKNLVPALLGNVAGGILFVTMLHYVQAQYTERR